MWPFECIQMAASPILGLIQSLTAPNQKIVFTSRGKRGKTALPLSPCLNIVRVSSHRVLGVILNNRLKATDRVVQLLSSCSIP